MTKLVPQRIFQEKSNMVLQEFRKVNKYPWINIWIFTDLVPMIFGYYNNSPYLILLKIQQPDPNLSLSPKLKPNPTKPKPSQAQILHSPLPSPPLIPNTQPGQILNTRSNFITIKHPQISFPPPNFTFYPAFHCSHEP